MFTFIFLILTGMFAFQPATPVDGYSYWYDQTQNVWRIEATDGSTQYSIAAWETLENGRSIRYADWSPSGTWLAWQTVTSEFRVPIVNVVSLSGEPISLPNLQQSEYVFVQWLGINDWLVLMAQDHRMETPDQHASLMIYDVNRRSILVEFSWQLPDLVDERLNGVQGDACSELSCQRPLPERVVRQIQSRIMLDDATCHVELDRTSSHSTLLVHTQPELDIQNLMVALSGICYGICDTGFPIVGYLSTDNVEMIYWYQVDYHGRAGWINIQDDARLVGQCDDLSAIPANDEP